MLASNWRFMEAIALVIRVNATATALAIIGSPAAWANTASARTTSIIGCRCWLPCSIVRCDHGQRGGVGLVDLVGLRQGLSSFLCKRFIGRG